jgi:hypothetical protein
MYLFLTEIKRTMHDGIRQMPLAIIIGRLGINIPYMNQQKTPNVMMPYVPIDMLEVSPDVMTL